MTEASLDGQLLEKGDPNACPSCGRNAGKDSRDCHFCGAERHGRLKEKTSYRATRLEKALAWIFTIGACAAVGGYLLRELLRRP